MGGVEIDD